MLSNAKSLDQVRKEIGAEREQLAHAVEQLRTELHQAADVSSKLPVLAAGALAGGFVLAGGIGATARLLFRRGREGRTRAKVGRFKVV
ncbi:MAG: hypothetical protein ACXVZL_10060, partial [Gaiellaceae bacterium]